MFGWFTKKEYVPKFKSGDILINITSGFECKVAQIIDGHYIIVPTYQSWLKDVELCKNADKRYLKVSK